MNEYLKVFLAITLTAFAGLVIGAIKNVAKEKEDKWEILKRSVLIGEITTDEGLLSYISVIFCWICAILWTGFGIYYLLP